MNLSVLTAGTAVMANDSQQQRYAGLYTKALNLAQQQFALDSKALWKDWPTTTVTDGQASYSLPSDFMYEKMVTLDGVELQPTNRHELQVLKRGTRWDDDTGTPTRYMVDPELARQKLLLYPIPTSYDAGKAIVLTYYPLPADMAADADLPLNATPLLAQFHVALQAWAAWYLILGEEATAAMIAKRRELLDVYNGAVSQAVDTFKNTAAAPLRMRGSRAY